VKVGAGLPTAMTIASRDERYALEWARSLSAANFRAYSSNDVTGVGGRRCHEERARDRRRLLGRPRLRRETRASR
jgi:hypothetical protein